MKQMLHFSKDRETMYMKMNRFDKTYRLIMEGITAANGPEVDPLYSMLVKKYSEKILTVPEIKEAADKAINGTWDELEESFESGKPMTKQFTVYKMDKYAPKYASPSTQVYMAVKVVSISDDEVTFNYPKGYNDLYCSPRNVMTSKKGEIFITDYLQNLNDAWNKKIDDDRNEYESKHESLKKRRAGIDPSEVEGYEEFKKQVIALRKKDKYEGSKEFEDLFKSQPEDIKDAYIKDEESQPVHSYSSVYSDRSGFDAAQDDLEQQKRSRHISYLESLCEI